MRMLLRVSIPVEAGNAAVPFGTALGIYSLWVLLPAEADADYAEQVRRANSA